MDKASGTEFQTVSELHLLRRFRLSSFEIANNVGPSRIERDRLLDEERFMLMLAVDPEFYHYCHRRSLSESTSEQWLEELGFALALALVLPKTGSKDGTGEAEARESLFERIVTLEKLSELNQTYPEIFMSEPMAIGGMPQRLGDLLALTNGTSPQSMAGGDPIGAFAEALRLAFPEGYEPEALLEAIARHSALRAISLDDLQQFKLFQETIGNGVDQLVQTLGDQKGVELVVAGEIISGRGPMELIYRIANGGTMLRWFRQLGQADRETCLDADLSLPVDEASAERAVSLAVQLFGPDASTWERILGGAEAYREYGNQEATAWTYSALLDCQGLDARRQALAHNRLAVIHRESGLTRRALTEFLEANILWEELKETWDEAVTAAFIAECYHQLGKDKQARRYLDDSFRKFQECSCEPERMARGMYYLAGSANTLGDHDMERTALQRGVHLSEPLADPELFIELNHRLLSLPW